MPRYTGSPWGQRYGKRPRDPLASPLESFVEQLTHLIPLDWREVDRDGAALTARAIGPNGASIEISARADALSAHYVVSVYVETDEDEQDSPLRVDLAPAPLHSLDAVRAYLERALPLIIRDLKQDIEAFAWLQSAIDSRQPQRPSRAELARRLAEEDG